MPQRRLSQVAGAGFLMALLLSPGACRQPEATTAGRLSMDAPVDLAALQARPLYTFSEAEVDAYLRGLAERIPDLRERVVHLGRKNIGQPYEIYLLGEFPFETHDPDPLYCLTKSDCVVFSEHTFAMALSRDWWEFLQTLQRLRYRDGAVGMLTRNHWTVAEWDRHNGFLFDDLTTTLGGGAVHVPLNQTLRRAAFFAKFDLGQDIPDEAIVDAYIPRERVPEILDELRSADFVNIVRGNSQAQHAGHVGLITLGMTER